MAGGGPPGYRIIGPAGHPASLARPGATVVTPANDNPGSGATRPSLLIRLRNPGDDEAWRDFVETYAPLVFGYCRRRGLQPSDVADVTQEVMAQVAKSMRDFAYSPDRGRFRDWLGTVTRTKILKFLRRDDRAGKGSGGETAGELIGHIAAPESDTAWTEAFQARVMEVALGRIRHGFEASTWRAFERAWIDGQAAPAVARELGITVDLVYVAKSRVLKRLRDEVAALADDFPHPALSPG